MEITELNNLLGVAGQSNLQKGKETGANGMFSDILKVPEVVLDMSSLTSVLDSDRAALTVVQPEPKKEIVKEKEVSFKEKEAVVEKQNPTKQKTVAKEEVEYAPASAGYEVPVVKEEKIAGQLNAEGAVVIAEEIQKLPHVDVVDLATGKTVTLPGEVLAEVMQSDGLQAVALTKDGQNVLALLPEQTTSLQVQNVDGQIALPQGVEMVQPEQVALFVEELASNNKKAGDILDVQLPLTEAVVTDAEVFSSKDIKSWQEQELSAKINSSENIKISVTTENADEVNFVARDLLANKAEVSKVVEAVKSSEGVNQNVADQLTVNNQPQLTGFAHIGSMQETQNVNMVTQNVIRTELGANNGVQNAVAGMAHTKTATAIKEQDNNLMFKDALKGMSKEVADQVKVNITKSAVKGLDKIEIQLKPKELGTIEVKMEIGKDGKLQAHIVASKEQTMQLLKEDVADLTRAFQDAGFSADEGSLSFSHRQENNAMAKNAESRDKFIGDILGEETAEVVNIYEGDRLNIRV